MKCFDDVWLFSKALFASGALTAVLTDRCSPLFAFAIMPDSAEGTCQEVRPSVPQIHALRVQAVLCPNTRCEVSHTQHYATKTKKGEELAQKDATGYMTSQ